jgi:hypothetical protein
MGSHSVLGLTQCDQCKVECAAHPNKEAKIRITGMCIRAFSQIMGCFYQYRHDAYAGVILRGITDVVDESSNANKKPTQGMKHRC